MSLLSDIMASLQATDLEELHAFALIGRRDLQGEKGRRRTRLWVASSASVADVNELRCLAKKYFAYPKHFRLQLAGEPFGTIMYFMDKAEDQEVTIHCFKSATAAADAYRQESQPAAAAG